MRLPDCPHRPPCPGCPAYGQSLETLDGTARLRALAEAAGIALQTLQGPQVGYRHRARLAVRGRAGSPKLGIFQAGSHRIVDTPRCVVHHPLINRVAAAMRAAMRATGSAPYADTPHRGLVRYLQVTIDAGDARPQTAGDARLQTAGDARLQTAGDARLQTAGDARLQTAGDARAQVVVVCNDTNPDAAEPLLQALSAELGTALHSLFWNGQPARSNAILGPHWAHVSGPQALCLPIGGAEVYFPPDAFVQNNLALYGALVDWVHARVPDGARVAELYAGVGAIGLGLLGRCDRVVFNEIGTGSLQGLQLGLAALPADLAERAAVVPGAAGACLSALDDASVVIADPPRRGLDTPLLQRLCARPEADLLYVSCGLASFERDFAALLDAGYRLVELAAADLFPFTGHLESLALLRPGGR